MRIALAQINPTVGDLAGNVERIARAVERAKEAGAALAVLPELAVTGYPPRDLLERGAFVASARRALDRVAASARGIAVLTGCVIENPNQEGRRVMNAAALCEDGAVRATVAKRLLPTYDVFDEDRYFEPGACDQPPLSIGGVPFGVTICEDMWAIEGPRPGVRLHRHDPVAELARLGARVLVNISASPYHRRKPAHRIELARLHVGAQRLPFLFVNQVGGNDDLLFDGNTFALDRNGALAARARDWEEDLLLVEVEAEAGSVHGEIHPTSESEVEDVWRALVLGTRDYARKCGFRSACIGLSGGIDSALTAAIAAEALGKENVVGVSMPSRFSSPGSKDDARELATNLGIRYLAVPIEPMFQAFLEQLKEPFEGRPFDVAEENVQARVRGIILMALSNKFGHLVLSTGNKSEMATGYCTLYGDMAGGLAVISDVPKMLVYALAHHVNRAGEVIPRASIEKAPSAELRPNQTDQDSLPPYALLDQVLELYIEEGLDEEEIIARGLDPKVVRDVVRMVERNEYKRKQAPPGLRVTTKAFGVGRRYPLAKKVTWV